MLRRTGTFSAVINRKHILPRIISQPSSRVQFSLDALKKFGVESSKSTEGPLRARLVYTNNMSHRRTPIKSVEVR
uniref:Uncharacterized protein n=1 Tax=Lepeophtheirus salmonis TaxID=72036 RepID=A0A0K2VCH2_LEPSM